MNIKKREKANNTKNIRMYSLILDSSIAIFEEIFAVSKKIPIEKDLVITHALRSSRMVCAYLAEAWREKRKKAVFINRLSDAAQEASKTQNWLKIAATCKCIDEEMFKRIDARYEHFFELLGSINGKASFTNV